MKIEKEKLISALEILSLVPQRPGMSASEYIRITTSGKKMTLALSSEVLGVVSFPIEGKFPCKEPFYLDRRVAVPFMLAGRDSKSDFELLSDEVEVESVEKRKKPQKKTVLVIRQGKRSAAMVDVPEVHGYGEIKIDKNSKKVKFSEEQRSLIKAAFNCASPDPSLPELNCVYITSQGFILSYNTIAMMIGKTEKFKESLPFPLHLLSMIQHEKDPTIYISKDKVILEFKEGMIAQSLSVKAVKKFPVKDVMSKAHSLKKVPYLFSINAAKLFNSMDRFSSYISAVRKQDQVIRVIVKKKSKQVKIVSNVPNIKLTEEVTLEKPSSSDLVCEWPLDILRPVIQFLGSGKTRIDIHSDEKTKSPYFLSTDDVTLLVARRA